jgi:hypothetical protein
MRESDFSVVFFILIFSSYITISTSSFILFLISILLPVPRVASS